MIGPGATIGILGGGQLAWMLGLEADRMGYRTAVLDPSSACPASRIARLCVEGALDDAAAAERLAREVDVITCDTEHVPAEVLQALEPFAPVRPAPGVLRTIQDRLAQRRFIESIGAPQPRNVSVAGVDELQRARAVPVCFPGVLKSRRSGYDGKGQARVQEPAELEAAWKAIGHAPAVLEAFVPFDKEISVLLARGMDGEIRFHPIAENQHRAGILRLTRVPARVSSSVAQRAREIGVAIAEGLDHVGFLAVELFVCGEELLVNEIAPRVHNSGHFSFGGCTTSQFEQHLRAICGLPLAEPVLVQPTVMVNVLGEAFGEGRDPVLQVETRWPSARMFHYGKAAARPGRKMGHVLCFGPEADAVHDEASGMDAALHPDEM